MKRDIDSVMATLSELRIVPGGMRWAHDPESPMDTWHTGDPCKRCGEPMRDPGAIDEKATVRRVADAGRDEIVIDTGPGK